MRLPSGPPSGQSHSTGSESQAISPLRAFHSTVCLHSPQWKRSAEPKFAIAGRDDHSVTDIDDLRSRLLTTERLLGRGLSSQALSRSVRAGELIRVRPGFYVEGDARELPREARHLLSVLAADSALGSPVFSHSSAAAVLGLPLWGLPLRRVVVSENGAKCRSRTTNLTTHRSLPLQRDDVISIDGLRVTTPALTVVDIATSAGRDAAVSVADAAVNRELLSEASLERALEQAAGRMGIKQARAAMAMVDGRSESVAETLSRLTFCDYGLPTPETQANIFDTHGNRIARVDFYWREYGVIGECDGFAKYFDGAGSAETRRRLAREKDRDAELMALGNRVIHWRWADLEMPQLLAGRVRRVLFPVAA